MRLLVEAPAQINVGSGMTLYFSFGKSLDDLPEGTREPFQSICELAYKGVVDNRIIFSSESKGVPNKSNLLGLIQGVVSL